jgi:SAM-dependent methyltransferase
LRSTDSKTHWENVYKQKNATDVTWYAPHLATTFRPILDTKPSLDAEIIDIGVGTSTLVDDLWDRGFRRVTVLDVSSAALNMAKKRLGRRANAVQWLEADITTVQLPRATHDLWHDRAVFHFLTREIDRKKYVENLKDALKPAGRVVISTFALEGPTCCSGPNVMRHSAEMLRAELGKEFELLNSLTENHVTPWGSTQKFLYCHFKR